MRDSWQDPARDGPGGRLLWPGGVARARARVRDGFRPFAHRPVTPKGVPDLPPRCRGGTGDPVRRAGVPPAAGHHGGRGVLPARFPVRPGCHWPRRGGHVTYPARLPWGGHRCIVRGAGRYRARAAGSRALGRAGAGTASPGRHAPVRSRDRWCRRAPGRGGAGDRWSGPSPCSPRRAPRGYGRNPVPSRPGEPLVRPAAPEKVERPGRALGTRGRAGPAAGRGLPGVRPTGAADRGAGRRPCPRHPGRGSRPDRVRRRVIEGQTTCSPYISPSGSAISSTRAPSGSAK
jgi:hypothetical protein